MQEICEDFQNSGQNDPYGNSDCDVGRELCFEKVRGRLEKKLAEKTKATNDKAKGKETSPIAKSDVQSQDAGLSTTLKSIDQKQNLEPTTKQSPVSTKSPKTTIGSVKVKKSLSPVESSTRAKRKMKKLRENRKTKKVTVNPNIIF